MYLPAVAEDALAHVLDDRRQFVGTDMRVGFVEDGVRCPEEMEEFHDALHVTPFLGAGEEFAVGESAGASFAETVVRLGVEPFVSVQQRYIFFALADFFAPLVDDGFDAVLDERQRCKQPCRSGADDDDLPLRVMHIFVFGRLIAPPFSLSLGEGWGEAYGLSFLVN